MTSKNVLNKSDVPVGRQKKFSLILCDYPSRLAAHLRTSEVVLTCCHLITLPFSRLRECTEYNIV